MNRRRNNFARRVLTAVGITILGFLFLALIWRTGEALLVVFAGVLLAVFLRALSDWLSRMTRLSGGWSLAIVILAIIAILGLGGWFLADRIGQQLGQIRQTLPVSLDEVER